MVDDSTPLMGAVTALAISQVAGHDRIWARSSGSIGFSDNGGSSWRVLAIPPSVNGWGTGGRSRGDDFAIAALGATAAVLFVADPSTTPELMAQQECNPKIPGQNHKTTILYFRDDTNDWAVSVWSACDGTGLGGRRMIKSVVPTSPFKSTPLKVNARIFVEVGQDIGEVTKVADDRTWTISGLSKSGTHSDFWDVAVAPGGQLSLANDGGVFNYSTSSRSWAFNSVGLHTHHIHTLTELATSAEPRLLYSTSDNDSWERNNAPFKQPITGWRVEGNCGDTNNSEGDVAVSVTAVEWRHGACGNETNFTSSRKSVAVMCTPAPNKDDGNKLECSGAASALPPVFTVIQTPSTELPDPELDAVALVTLPLQIIHGNAIVDAPGPLGAGRGLAIIRNQNWLKAVDTTKDVSNWTLVDGAHPLPPGAHSVLVSGGHAQPTFFVVATADNREQLWRDDVTGWTRLDPGADILTSDALYGSVFVNPFDPKHMFVLATDGVRVSTDGATFARDDVLTKLVTASQKYAFSASIDANGSGVVLASRAARSASVSSIAFSRSSPHQVLVGSALTGAYWASDDRRVWRDVGHDLPLGGAQVSAVGLDDFGGYVATEGRGVFAVTALPIARLATYFENSADPRSGVVATLMRSDGKPAAGAVVQVWLLSAAGEAETSRTTDDNGRVTLPAGSVAAGTSVYLSVASAGVIGGCEAAFRY
nr:hypothetical protein [Kofleriaceae bacterium]